MLFEPLIDPGVGTKMDPFSFSFQWNFTWDSMPYRKYHKCRYIDSSHSHDNLDDVIAYPESIGFPEKYLFPEK